MLCRPVRDTTLFGKNQYFCVTELKKIRLWSLYLVFRCRINLRKNGTNTRNFNFKQDRQCTYNVTLRRLTCNHCYSGKAIFITYCGCLFVGLGIQHAMRMRHIVFCGLSGSTIFFSHYLTNDIIFEKKNNNIEHKMCFLIFSTKFVWNISHSKKVWARVVKNVRWSSCKVRIYLVRFQWNLNFLRWFSKNIPISNITRVRPVKPESLHADGQT